MARPESPLARARRKKNNRQRLLGEALRHTAFWGLGNLSTALQGPRGGGGCGGSTHNGPFRGLRRFHRMDRAWGGQHRISSQADPKDATSSTEGDIPKLSGALSPEPQSGRHVTSLEDAARLVALPQARLQHRHQLETLAPPQPSPGHQLPASPSVPPAAQDAPKVTPGEEPEIEAVLLLSFV